MNYLKFLFFALAIYLESNVFPKYFSTFLKLDSITFYCAIMICFFTKFNFRKYNKLIIPVIVTIDLLCGFEIVNTVHNIPRQLTEISHYIFILIFVLIPFLFYDNEEAFSQMKNSNFFMQLFNFIIIIITVGFISAHFKWLYFTDAQEENFNNLNKFLKNFLVDYVVFFNAVTLTFLIKFYYSKSKKKVFLFEIFKRILLMALITIFFYLNYNIKLSQYIFNKFNEFVPQPHNLIIYNSIPHDQDTRFRLIVTTLMYSLL